MLPLLQILKISGAQYIKEILISIHIVNFPDKNDYDLLSLPENKLTTRLVHAFHMKEMWEMVKKSYLELVKNPPTDKNICSCVKDVENNLILANIKFIALWNR